MATWDELNKRAGGITPVRVSTTTGNTWDALNAQAKVNISGKKKITTKAPLQIKTNAIFDFLGITDYQTTYEQTQQTFLQNPFQAIKEAGSAIVGAFKSAIQSQKERYEEYKTAVQTKGTPAAQRIATWTQMFTGDIGILFSPISAAFSAAKKIPILQEAATILEMPFVVTGRVGGFAADKFVNALPIDQNTKDILSPAFEELGTLAGQILLGGKIIHSLAKGIVKGKKLETKTIRDNVKEIKAIEPKAQAVLEQKATEKGIKIEQPTKEIKLAEIKTISKELQPLAQEARKYKSVEEFVMGVAININKYQKFTAEKYGKIIPGAEGLGKMNRVFSTSEVNYLFQKINGQSLTDFYTQAVKGVKEVKPVLEAQPKPEVTNVVEGGKPSGIAMSIEARAIEQGLTKGFKDLAEYDPVTIKRQSQLMSDLMKTDIEKAKRVATGKEVLPPELKGSTALKAMEEYAMETRDGQLASELANSPLASETSVAGQTLRLLAEKDPNSAIIKIQEIMKERQMSAEKKLLGKTPEKVKTEIKESLKEKVKKNKPSKKSWERFIDEITC